MDNVCVVSRYHVAGGITALHLIPLSPSLLPLARLCLLFSLSAFRFTASRLLSVKQRDSLCFLTHAPPAAHPRPTES